MKLCNLCYIALFVFVVWSIYARRMVNYWFDKKYAHFARQEIQHHPEYKAFHRNDYQHWNRFHMTLGAIFLLPIRLTSFIAVLVFGLLYMKIIGLIYKINDLEAEHPPAFTAAYRQALRFCSKLCLYTMGFHRIKNISKPLSKSYNKLEGIKNKRASVLISNHVSIFDSFYLATRKENVTFIAKEGVKKVPLIGYFARIVQCIFIQRLNNQSESNTFEALSARVQKIEAGKNLSTVIIFPEGTVTNGRSLINFKTGAFRLGVPLKVVGLKYQGVFNPSLDLVSNVDSLLGMMMQPYNDLTVVEISDLVAPKDKNMKPEEFAEQVRLMMCEEFGFENAPNTFSKFVEFNKKYGNFEDKDFD